MSLLKSANFPKSFLSHIGKSNKRYQQNGISCHNSLSIYNAPNLISLFSKFSAFSEAIFRKRILLKSVNISKSFLSHIGKSKRFYQLKFLYQRIPFFTCFLYQESTVHFYIIALKWYAFNSNYLDTIKQIFRNNFRFYVHCLQIISIEQSKVKLVWKKAIATSIVFIVSWVMKYLTREYIFFSIK